MPLLSLPCRPGAGPCLTQLDRVRGNVPDFYPLAGALPDVEDAFVLGCVRGGYTIGPYIGKLMGDAAGNANVSRFGPRLAGAGGFINISQNARRVVFAGTFIASGLTVQISDGSLDILREGRIGKFLKQVEQVTCSGTRAARLGQPVLYVTERAVFELVKDGLRLTEIAPGVDLERDVLSLMDVAPQIGEVRQMDARLFETGEMGLRVDLLHLDLADCVALDSETQRLFLNFEKFRVRDQVRQTCACTSGRVDVIANYDGFVLDEALESEWAAMVAGLQKRFYGTVSRYSGSAFMRMKLSNTFPDGRAHIFQTSDTARSFLEEDEA